MILEQLEAMWAEDSRIDETDISQSSMTAYGLHSKYHKFLNGATRQLRKLESERDRMLLIKTDYYLRNIDHDTLKLHNWKPFARTILKSELPLYLNADDDMITLNLRISDLQVIVKFVDSIIRTLNSSSHHIKNIIDNNKFVNGVR